MIDHSSFYSLAVGVGPARSAWCYGITGKVPDYKRTSWGENLSQRSQWMVFV